MNKEYFKELNGYFVKDEEAIKSYDTVSDMKSDTKLVAGQHIKTKGYYSINDGGSAEYYIRTKTGEDIEDNGSIHFIGTLVAELIDNDNINIKQFGAKGDGESDDTLCFTKAISYLKNLELTSHSLEINPGTYIISSTITIPMYIKVHTLGNVLIKYTGENELFRIIPGDNIADMVSEWSTGQNVFNIGNVLDGSKGTLTLQGTGKNNGQIGLVIGANSLGTNWISGTFWANFSNFCIEKFNIGIQYTNKQVCMHKFFNMVITYCNKAISDINNLENSGELMTYLSCSFNNNDLFLEINHPINHNFDNCNIDYNKQGVQINYQGGYYQLTITNSWLEGNCTPSEDLPYIQAPNTNSNDSVNVVISNSYIYPGSFINKELFKGNMYLNLENDSVLVNRYSANDNYTNYPEGEFLCDEYVKIFNKNNIHYMSAPCITSKNTLLNKTNYNFETATVGETDTAPGFEFPSVAGDVDAVVTNEKSFTGTKSIKILGTGNDYKTIRTEELNVFKYKRIYANAVVYVPDYNGNDNTFACTVKAFFYDKNGTEISNVSQNYTGMTVPLSKCNKWMCLPIGLMINEGSATLPDNCYTVKIAVQFGALKTNIWVDNIAVEGF